MLKHTYSDWVKRLGQWHICEDDQPNTLCDQPMLGNNYARVIPENDREKCEECFSRYHKRHNG